MKTQQKCFAFLLREEILLGQKHSLPDGYEHAKEHIMLLSEVSMTLSQLMSFLHNYSQGYTEALCNGFKLHLKESLARLLRQDDVGSSQQV